MQVPFQLADHHSPALSSRVGLEEDVPQPGKVCSMVGSAERTRPASEPVFPFFVLCRDFEKLPDLDSNQD